jgi:hypothetical protein
MNRSRARPDATLTDGSVLLLGTKKNSLKRRRRWWERCWRSAARVVTADAAYAVWRRHGVRLGGRRQRGLGIRGRLGTPMDIPGAVFEPAGGWIADLSERLVSCPSERGFNAAEGDHLAEVDTLLASRALRTSGRRRLSTPEAASTVGRVNSISLPQPSRVAHLSGHLAAARSATPACPLRGRAAGRTWFEGTSSWPRKSQWNCGRALERDCRACAQCFGQITDGVPAPSEVAANHRPENSTTLGKLGRRPARRVRA